MRGNPDRQNVVSFADYASSRFLAAYLRDKGVVMVFVDELNQSVTANSGLGAGLMKSLLNSGACLQSILLGGEVRDGD